MSGQRHRARAVQPAPQSDNSLRNTQAGPSNSELAAALGGKASTVEGQQDAVLPAWAEAETKEAPKPFTRLGITDQMGYMAKLMDDNRALLDANDVSSSIEQKMAAQVPREIDENSRRGSVSRDFKKQAGKLHKVMDGVDLEDPAALKSLRGKLTEEQRFLLEKSMAGDLDLGALDSKDAAVKKENDAVYAEAGVECRSQQYGEMEALRKRKESGEKLGKDDARRLAELKKKPGYMAGASGMGDLWGMSEDRFGEIYAEGNTRFEASHYQRLRDDYDKNDASRDRKLAAHQKDPSKNKAPGDTVRAGSGIGDFDISAAGQKKIETTGTYDILGDIATSYGAGQVMGGYASSPDWKGHHQSERLQPITRPDQTSYTPSIADVKHSGRAHDPDANDLAIQMSLVKMGMGKRKRFDPNGEGLGQSMSNHNYITMYNGHRPGDTVYKQYMSSLTKNGPLYEAEKKKLAAEKKKPE